MCNSYDNHRNCCCCTSPASCNQNGNAHCGVNDCRRFARTKHHWYPDAQHLQRCSCCQKPACKSNDLLHHLCPVPGIRGETMKQILLAHPPKPLYGTPSTAVPQTLLPFLHSSDAVHGLESSDSKSADDKVQQRLIEKLKAGTTAQKKKCKRGVKNQCKDPVKEMNNWYAKEMKYTLQERGLPVYYIPGAPRKHQRRMSPRNTLLNFSYYINPNKYSMMSGSAEEEFEINMGSDTSLSTHFSIIQVNPDEPSDPEEVEEKVAIEDLRNLLKEVQNKPSRPILFHSPFDRDMAWTWRNYDPITDVPASLKKKPKRNRASEYSMWTMALVQNLISGNPVTDKKIKTNQELGKMVNQLATELKLRNEGRANQPQAAGSNKKVHHQRYHVN